MQGAARHRGITEANCVPSPRARLARSRSVNAQGAEGGSDMARQRTLFIVEYLGHDGWFPSIGCTPYTNQAIAEMRAAEEERKHGGRYRVTRWREVPPAPHTKKGSKR